LGNPLQGQVVLVAGASQGGTGTASAVRLAAEGAKVAICARSVDKMRSTLDQVEQVGGSGVMFECDLSDPAGGRDTLIARTEDALGPVSYLVYVAARTSFSPFEAVTQDRLQSVLEVNFKAAWLLTQQVVERLRQRQAQGSIVYIGTKAAQPLVGPPYGSGPNVKGGTVYGSTKAALRRLAQGVAAETYGHGITVNVLSPLAAIATPQVVSGGMIPPDLCEPVETMAEAVLALLTAGTETTGLDTTSIDYLMKTSREVRGLDGGELVPGWQPADLPGFVSGVAAGSAPSG
jgi:citronellol/citronellal dehydrogenase